MPGESAVRVPWAAVSKEATAIGQIRRVCTSAGTSAGQADLPCNARACGRVRRRSARTSSAAPSWTCSDADAPGVLYLGLPARNPIGVATQALASLPDGDWLLHAYPGGASICGAAGCETEPRFSRCGLIGETTTKPRSHALGQTIEELARFSSAGGAAVPRHFWCGASGQVPRISLAEPRGARVSAGV